MAATAAAAATPLPTYNLPPQPMDAAIVAIATTAHVSIGGENPDACAKRSALVQGRLDALSALRQALRGSQCRVRQLDATTFLIEPRPRLFAARHQPLPAPTVAPPAATEVIVTANRRPQLAGDAPSAISVIGADSLAASGGNLSAVAARVPGLTLTNLGSGRDKILLRGISDGVFTGRTQSTVGLYLDDTPITFNAPDPDLLLVDMARIEVLRGPQGALYGEGSISGIVRLVTRQPDLAAYATRVDTAIGLTQGGAASTRLEGVVNLPLIRDRLAVRAVAYDDQSGGYIDDVALSQKATNATHRYGARAALRWRPDDHWTWTATYAAQEINARNSQYVSGGLGPFTRPVALAEPHDNDFTNLSLGAEGLTRLGTLHASLNHLHHHIQSRYDAGALAIPGTDAPRAYDESQTVELTTQDVTLTSPATGRLRWLVGLFAANSAESFNPRLSGASGGESLYAEDRRDRVDTLAMFGEVSYDLTQRLTLTTGLRQTDTRLAMSSRQTTGSTPQALNEHLDTHRLSHQVVIRYRLDDHVMLYAQSAEGYRNGGFNTTRLANSPPVPSRYAGDELNSAETGVKFSWPQHRLHLSAAAYRVAWRGIQSDQLQATGLPVTVNIGDGENTGLEIEADWALDTLALHGAALINEPRLTRPDPLYATAEDSGLPFIARHSYSLSADWHKNLGTAILDSNATLSWRGRSHLNFGALQTVEMGGYSQLDLATRLTLGQLRYTLRVDNLTNTRGNSFAYGNPFSLPLTPQSTPLRPRTIWLSLGMGF